MKALAVLGAGVSNVDYQKRLDGERKHVVATFDVQAADTVRVPKLVECLEALPAVRRIRVQHHA